MVFPWGKSSVRKSNLEVFADLVDAVAAIMSTWHGAAGVGVHALVGQVRAGRHAHLRILDAEPALPDHGPGHLLTGHDALVDVLVKRVGVVLGAKLVGKPFAGRDTAFEQLEGRVNLRKVIGPIGREFPSCGRLLVVRRET